MRARERNEMIEKIELYIGKRKQIDKDYKHFWGSFFGGFSKQEKISAAQALINYLKDEATLNELLQQLEPLKQGTLRHLWDEFKKKFPNKMTRINKELESKESYIYYNTSGYDSDTEERIRGRCSKD